MGNNKLVYRLYKDLKNAPDKGIYIKPLLCSAGTTIATIGSNLIVPNDGMFVGCLFLTGCFFASGVFNIHNYKSHQRKYDLSLERFSNFNVEAKKVIDKDLGVSKVKLMASYVGSNMDSFVIVYKDDSQLIESIDNDSRCIYYDSDRDDVFDLSDARDFAYSINFSKK